MQRPGVRPDERASELLGAYRWPGQRARLENAVERALVITPEDVIGGRRAAELRQREARPRSRRSRTAAERAREVSARFRRSRTGLRAGARAERLGRRRARCTTSSPSTASTGVRKLERALPSRSAGIGARAEPGRPIRGFEPAPRAAQTRSRARHSCSSARANRTWRRCMRKALSLLRSHHCRLLLGHARLPRRKAARPIRRRPAGRGWCGTSRRTIASSTGCTAAFGRRAPERRGARRPEAGDHDAVVNLKIHDGRTSPTFDLDVPCVLTLICGTGRPGPRATSSTTAGGGSK
jgi:hypothetical protein